MLVAIQKRKCLRCGHKFTYALGGIILIMEPKCPKCDSRKTIKIGSWF